MTRMSFVLIVFICSGFSATASDIKEISVQYKNLSYSIIQTKEKFKYTYQGNTLSFDIRSCNKNVFKMIWSKLNVAKKHFTNRVPANKSPILFTEGKTTQKVSIYSKLGSYLEGMPTRLQNLDIWVHRACSK